MDCMHIRTLKTRFRMAIAILPSQESKIKDGAIQGGHLSVLSAQLDSHGLCTSLNHAYRPCE